jgi:hypothetical protein
MADAKATFTLSARDQTKRVFGKVRRGLGGIAKSAFRATAAIARAAAGVAGIAGGVGFAAMAAKIDGMAASLDKLGKTSKLLGVSPEFMSLMEFVSDRSGVAQGAFQTGLQRMVRRLGEAAAGTGEAKKAIKDLGFNAQALANIPVEKQFLSLMEALSKIDNVGRRNSLATKIFDTEGLQLLQMTEGGFGSLIKTMKEGERLGAIRPTSLTASAAGYEDAFTNAGTAMNALFVPLAEWVLPRVARQVGKITDFLVDLRNRGVNALPDWMQHFIGFFSSQEFDSAVRALKDNTVGRDSILGGSARALGAGVGNVAATIGLAAQGEFGAAGRVGMLGTMDAAEAVGIVEVKDPATEAMLEQMRLMNEQLRRNIEARQLAVAAP